MNAAKPLVSVVIETNQNDPDSTISVGRVLGRLAEQTYPSEYTEVLVVVHDQANELAGFVQDNHPFARVVRSGDPGYYPMKIAGAAQARGDVVAFIDSDTLPRSDWLERVVRTIEGGADVSVGAMRYEQGRRLARVRSFVDWGHIHGDENGRASNLLSNSAAFRRDVWERHPFDASLRRSGACYLLGAELKRRGYVLTFDPEQRIFHRDCYVGRAYFERRLRAGYDSIQVGRRGRDAAEGKAMRAGPAAPLVIFAGRVVYDLRTLKRHRREFDIRAAELPLFAAAAVGARFFELIGAGVELVRPGWLERRLAH